MPNALLPLLPSHAEIDAVLGTLLGREGFHPSEALAVAAEGMTFEQAERIELAVLRHVLGLQPGQTLCGQHRDDRTCLEPAGHERSGAWHRGRGASWSL